MAVLKTRTISKRTVDALTVEKDTVFWDSELTGFGVRVYPTGGKTYVVQTRADGKPARRIAIGRHGIVLGRGSAAPGGADRLPDQGRRGAGAGAPAG